MSAIPGDRSRRAVRFFLCLAELRRLALRFALRSRKFAPLEGLPCVFLVERLAIFHRACDQFLFRRSGLLGLDVLFPSLLFKCFRIAGCGLLELPEFLDRVAQLCGLQLAVALRGG